MRAIRKVTSAAVAITAAAGAAAASPTQTVTGRIDHLNPRGQSLIVRNEVYRYDPRLIGVGLRAGETVRIQYREQHGHRVASRITPVS